MIVCFILPTLAVVIFRKFGLFLLQIVLVVKRLMLNNHRATNKLSAIFFHY